MLDSPLRRTEAGRVLGDLWAGAAEDDSSWRFNLKAEIGDGPGELFPVRVPVDVLRDDVLRVFVRNARQGRETRVSLTGTLTAFDAPTNVSRLRGLRMDRRSSRDIRLD